MSRVLIVDDHPIVRQGLRWVLDNAVGIETGGEATNGVEALEILREGKFDIVLLDISMPEKDGIDVLKEIMDMDNEIKVLILSIHPENKYAVHLMKAGASGYLTKDAVPKQLVEAIRTVAEGKKFVSPYLAELLLHENASDAEKLPHTLLTNMEYRVLRLMGLGHQLAEIAEILSLSPETVRFYRTLLLKKMKMRDNAELTSYAIRNGLSEIR
jgi:two-component system invasion response regulator UvrY